MSRQKTSIALSLLTTLLCIGAVVISARIQRQNAPFPFGDLSAVSVEEARETYAASGKAEDLIALLKVLCYQVHEKDNEALTADIARVGTALLDMARAEEIDLEELGDKDETLLDLLRMIKEYGAK